MGDQMRHCKPQAKNGQAKYREKAPEWTGLKGFWQGKIGSFHMGVNRPFPEG